MATGSRTRRFTEHLFVGVSLALALGQAGAQTTHDRERMSAEEAQRDRWRQEEAPSRRSPAGTCLVGLTIAAALVTASRRSNSAVTGSRLP